jgi:hypothetical protein
MLNKKAILSVIILVTSIVITIGNTWAFITSNEVKNTGTINLGILHLTTDPDTSMMTIKNVSPGSQGTLYHTITNSGTVPGKLKIDFSNFQESVATEGTSKTTGKDTLLHNVKVNIKLVKASDGTLVKRLKGSESNFVPIISCRELCVSNIPMDANTAYKLVIDYEIPDKTDNGIQGKKLTFGVTYTLST